MFSCCYHLTSEATSQLGSTGFCDFSTCTDMYGMFDGCSSLDAFNPQFTSKFKTSKVKYMDCMFRNTSLELFNFPTGTFDTSSTISFNSMFENCTNLKTVDLGRSGLKSTSSICDARNMFINCSKITQLNLSRFKFVSIDDYNAYINTPIERNFNWDKDEDHRGIGIGHPS